MGGWRSQTQQNFDQIKQTLKSHNFTNQELRRLWHRFQLLSGGKILLKRSSLQNVPELRLNPLSQRIVDQFVDQPDRESISFNSFVQNLSVFSFRASEHEKIQFLFKIYDADGDGFISRDELESLLRTIVGENIVPQQLQLLISGTLQDADLDGDGRLSFAEFASSVQKNPTIADKLTVRL